MQARTRKLSHLNLSDEAKLSWGFDVGAVAIRDVIMVLLRRLSDCLRDPMAWGKDWRERNGWIIAVRPSVDGVHEAGRLSDGSTNSILNVSYS